MKQPDSYFGIAELVTKFLMGELTPDESGKLQAWIAEREEHRKIWERLTNPAYIEKRLQYWNDRDKAAYWEMVKAEMMKAEAGGRSGQRRIIFLKTMRYAAVLLPFLLIFGIGGYLLRNREKKPVERTATLAGANIVPRGKVAQLVLGNGKIVNLNDSLQESITEKDGTKVRNRLSALSYASGRQQDNAPVIYNTLLTPRGGEYQVKLSDGTKVWINAASSLRYPTQFSGKEREVYLTGEAYFEVAKDEQHPFVVKAANTNVTVLGTRFNVAAYADDPPQKITLAEGSVRVADEAGRPPRERDNNGVLLKPGEEAVLMKDDHNIRVNKANMEAALAWKNGMFVFDAESLGSLMRKLSRWYDIDVVYADGVDTLFHFTGRIQRDESINGILHLIELTGKVHFAIKGRQLEVIPVLQG